jgi:hypothetical protein
MTVARNRYGSSPCTLFSNVTDLTCAGAAAGRTRVWSYTPIQAEFIGEINSGIAMLR